MAQSLPAGHASAATASSKFKITATPFSIEGSRTSIATINKDNTTYIALRSLNNYLGLSTNYEKATQVVKIEGRGRVLQINLQNNAITLNGQLILFGPKPIGQDNTTYLPLRFLLERMGYDVSYEQARKLIEIHAIQENKLKIQSQVIGADGDGKSLLVYYPVISGYENVAVQQKINAFLKAEADRNVAAGSKQMQQAVAENNKILADNPKATVRQPSFDGHYTVTYNEKGRLSLFVDYYIYTGGAHGVTARVPYTFDLATGNVLSLKEVADGNANYVSIINSKIKAQIKSRKMLLLNPFQTIEADRDYFLNRTGVVIYFTNYEYTSFAEGMPEFVIPYTDFR
ncbi:stalk domain-containing protein [Aneurinibacillus tyrosinisolvens]|uniref:stalk domain-containing protein n=1 Tax=Aneurinibacillus tyrosinisolvens TaxID=1443435 RepID=UPI001EEF0123|nr:stalk domain-containing protein [Aneurinibacillus tyrosinisolvens]